MASMTSYTYELFKLIKPDYTPEKTQGEHFGTRKKELKDLLNKWQKGETFFESEWHGKASWQIKEFKKFLKKMSEKFNQKNFELDNQSKFDFQFLPCVLLAEELGIIKIHSFEYNPTDFKKSAVVEKDYAVHMKFKIDILDTDAETTPKPIIHTQNIKKTYTSPTTKEVLVAEFDEKGIAQKIRLNNRLLLLGKDKMKRADIRMLGALIFNDGRCISKANLKEAMGKNYDADDRVINDAAHRLRNNGGVKCLETVKDDGRKLS